LANFEALLQKKGGNEMPAFMWFDETKKEWLKYSHANAKNI
jgi:hypothetical protein